MDYFCSVRGRFGSVVFFRVRFGKKFGSAGFPIVRFGVLPNRIRTKTEQKSTPPTPLEPSRNPQTRVPVRKNDVRRRFVRFAIFRFSRKFRSYRFGRFFVQGGEGFRQGGRRFGAAANTLVDEALFDASPFHEAGSTFRGMLRNQNSPN